MNIKNKIALSLVAASVAMLSTGCGSDDTTAAAPAAADVNYEVKQSANLETSVSTGGSTATGSSTTGNSSVAGTKQTLSGTLTTQTLDASKDWIIDGLVVVPDGVTLTIDAGVTIAGKAGTGASTSYMIVAAGGKIIANGTATNPVTFTSETALDGGTAAVGQWGGLTIIGKAANDQVSAYEVNSAYSALATDLTDNSGTLTHVKILNSGITMEQDKEINGLSLIGVGSSTTISDITIKNSDDDGIEAWGGTVNMSNISITGCTDDFFDIDDGYAGTVTNMVINNTGTGNAGIEMSGTTHATFSNIDITLAAGAYKEGGIFFKKDGAGGNFTDVTVTNNATNAYGAIYTQGASDTANISFTNVILEGTSEYKVTENETDSSGSAQAIYDLF